jgi:hypothetical protein
METGINTIIIINYYKAGLCGAGFARSIEIRNFATAV